jgi:hypothetical protein
VIYQIIINIRIREAMVRKIIPAGSIPERLTFFPVSEGWSFRKNPEAFRKGASKSGDLARINVPQTSIIRKLFPFRIKAIPEKITQRDTMFINCSIRAVRKIVLAKWISSTPSNLVLNIKAVAEETSAMIRPDARAVYPATLSKGLKASLKNVFIFFPVL